MEATSLQEADSIVNIVEFGAENNISPKSLGGGKLFHDNYNSIIVPLSSPFKHDEQQQSNYCTINAQHYATHKAPYSQSVLESVNAAAIDSKIVTRSKR